jgi:hypothetical protein
LHSCHQQEAVRAVRRPGTLRARQTSVQALRQGQRPLQAWQVQNSVCHVRRWRPVPARSAQMSLQRLRCLVQARDVRLTACVTALRTGRRSRIHHLCRAPKPSTIILFKDSTLRRSQVFFYFFPCVKLRLSGGDLNAAAAKSRAPTVQFPTSPLRPNCPLPPLANTRVAHHHHWPQPLSAVYLKHCAISVAAPACHPTHMLCPLIAQDSASKRSTP